MSKTNSAKDELIKAALGYNFDNNADLVESVCNNSLCKILRKAEFCYKNDQSDRKDCDYNTQNQCKESFSNETKWCREKNVKVDKKNKYIDLFNKNLLAETKIWKTHNDKRAFDVDGHEYPFVYLGGSLNNNFLNTFSICSEKINNRKKELETAEKKQTENSPKIAGKMGAIQGVLCCFQSVAGGSCLIATDADEGQLFYDFVKMLNYSTDPVWDSEDPNYSYDMLQVLYIVTENGKWGHVHEKEYIIVKLNYLFKQFFDIAKNAGSFQVYCYKSLQPKVSYAPVVFPTAKVHVGEKFSVPAKGKPKHDVTPLVIEWVWPDNENEPDIIFKTCTNDKQLKPCECGCFSSLKNNKIDLSRL